MAINYLKSWFVTTGIVLFMSVAHAQSAAITLRTYTGSSQNAGDDLQPFFYVDNARTWPTHTIPVCWEVLDPVFKKERQWVEGAVKTYIEKNSAFRFGQNWGSCDGGSGARIRIIVADTYAESEVGYTVSNYVPQPTHMLMNFQFKNWLSECSASASKREQCIQTITVHEFLHAVGALHEQLNPDIQTKDPVCWQRYKNTGDDKGTKPTALTDYDPDSIMNYCKDIYATPTHLSALDLVGLKKLSDETLAKENE